MSSTKGLAMSDLLYAIDQMLSEPLLSLFDKHTLLKAFLLELRKAQKLLLQVTEVQTETLEHKLVELSERLADADQRHDSYQRALHGVLDTLKTLHEGLGDMELAIRFQQAQKTLFPSGLRVVLQSYERESAAVQQTDTILKQNPDLRNLLGNLTLMGETALEWAYKIVEAGKELRELLEERADDEEKLKQLKANHRETIGSRKTVTIQARRTLNLLEDTLNLLVSTDSSLESVKDSLLSPLHERQEAIRKSHSAPTETAAEVHKQS